MDIMKTFNIQLDDGAALKIEASAEFLSKVASYHNISSPDLVSEDDVKVFLLGSLTTMLEKLDNQQPMQPV